MNSADANQLFADNEKAVEAMPTAAGSMAKQFAMTCEKNGVYVRLRDPSGKRVHYTVVEGDPAKAVKVADHLGMLHGDGFVEAP